MNCKYFFLPDFTDFCLQYFFQFSLVFFLSALLVFIAIFPSNMYTELNSVFFPTLQSFLLFSLILYQLSGLKGLRNNVMRFSNPCLLFNSFLRNFILFFVKIFDYMLYYCLSSYSLAQQIQVFSCEYLCKIQIKLQNRISHFISSPHADFRI